MKLKKWLLGLMTFAAMVVLCTVCTGAETYGDFQYSVLDDGTVEISGYNGSAERVDIPEMIDGKSVTSIGNFAFSNCASLTSITIPNSVTNIGGRTFYGCTSLTAINVATGNQNYVSVNGVLYNKDKTIIICYPAGKTGKSYKIINGVTSIGDSAFEKCINLTNITIPDGVMSIDIRAFENCTSLTSITIPNGVTSIGYEVFSGCTNLTSITIPDSVTSIGTSAFYRCINLTSIKIPFGVTCIGDQAFFGCTSLADITIPDSVISIGEWAFHSCTSFRSITIPDSVMSISKGAFIYCTSLTSITIPDSVMSIGDSAFYGCTSLKSITIPDSVTSIGHDAFSGCTSLTSITIPDSVTSINNSAFNGCTSLTSVMIPDSVTSIGDSAFSGCTSLTSITIPNSVTSIGYRAFRGCTSLTSVTIPASVTSIGEYAFSGCMKLLAIYVSEENEKYSSVNGILFDKHQKVLLCYPGGKTDSSYAIPDSVTTVSHGAFEGCTSLNSVTIPDSVTSIEGDTFNSCTSLTSITIPNSVTSIERNAFEGCTSLTSITIPDSVTSIEKNAFEGCTSLTTLNVATANKNYVSVNGVLFNKDKTVLICYPAGKKDKSYNIPSGVKGISDRAFDSCTNLKNVKIPDSMTQISEHAFQNCTSLTNVMIPVSVKDIYWCAFENCTSLVNVTIPDSVTRIASDAFRNCTSLTSITIPNSVNSISMQTFLGCIGLKSITIPDGVTSINTGAFNGCTSLTSVTIPDSVTRIEASAFSGCASLNSITIPKSVTSIKENAFGYYYDYDILHNVKYDDFIIYCYSGTAGEQYAKENGFAYELLDHTTHTYNKWTIIKAATCTADGTQTRTCSVCGKVETQTIAALGHTEVIDEAIEATCTKTGLTEGMHCSVCNAVIKAQETVPAKGHTEVIDKAVAATCTETGLTEGKHCSVCNTVIKAQEVVPANGHTEVVDKAVEATCTETGLTEGKHCSVCNTVIKAQEVVPAKGHKYVDTVVKPTYTAKGYTLHKCSVCGTSYKDTYTAKLTLAKVTGVKLAGRAADTLRINWAKNASADGYIVEMYQSGKWARVAKITSNSTTTFRKAGLKAGTAYKFRVRAYKMNGSTALYSNYSATVTAMTNPSVIKGAKLTGRAADALRINWAKNASADGYIVEMYKGNKWVRVAKITNNSTTTFRKAGLKASTVYKFRVRAYKMSGKTALYGNYSATVTARTNPSIVKGVKIAGKAKDALRVNWTKNASAQGYIVEMYKGGKWVRVAKITNGNTTTFRKAGLAKNTTYKFRVKAYYMSGKTALYGNYGSVSGKTAAK